MLLTIMLMAGGSLVIAILPTYAAVGWLAPILLLLARIAQGMSLGGEVSNASAYLAEIAPPNRRGRYSSFFYISTGTAVLLASLLGAFLASTLADDQLASWGWRIPFLIGAALGLVGLWMRRDMAETEQFEKNVAKAKAIKNPLMQTLREHPKSVAQLIGLTLLSTLCYYTFFSALTPFAVRGNGLDDGMVFWALSIATAMFVVLQYPFGWTADQFGRKPQLLVWSGAIALLMVPISTLIQTRGGLRVGVAGVLLWPRPLRDEELDRPGDHERAISDRATLPGHRYLVQPHRRPIRRHRSAGHPVAQQHRPQQLVLLVRLGRRSRRVRRHADPPGDQGVGAQVSWATDLLASRALSMSALGQKPTSPSSALLAAIDLALERRVAVASALPLEVRNNEQRVGVRAVSCAGLGGAFAAATRGGVCVRWSGRKGEVHRGEKQEPIRGSCFSNVPQ